MSEVAMHSLDSGGQIPVLQIPSAESESLKHRPGLSPARVAVSSSSRACPHPAIERQKDRQREGLSRQTDGQTYRQTEGLPGGTDRFSDRETDRGLSCEPLALFDAKEGMTQVKRQPLYPRGWQRRHRLVRALTPLLNDRQTDRGAP